MPWLWVQSQLCSEFCCLPSQLEQEDPRTMLDMAMMRAYARAKETLDNAKSEGDVKRTAMVERVWEIQAEIMKERRARRGA